MNEVELLKLKISELEKEVRILTTVIENSDYCDELWEEYNNQLEDNKQ